MSSLQRGWILTRRAPDASIRPVLTAVILSRIFQGGAGRLDGKAAAAQDCVVGDADAAGFARSTRGVGAGDDAAVYAVAAGYFFCKVPGGCAACEHDFIEDVKGVSVFYGADPAHGVHVEVHAQEEGLDGDVFGVGGDVVVGETDGDEAG